MVAHPVGTEKAQYAAVVEVPVVVFGFGATRVVSNVGALAVVVAAAVVVAGLFGFAVESSAAPKDISALQYPAGLRRPDVA